LYSPTLIEAGEELVSAVKSLKTIERSNDPDMIASAREHVAGARQKLSQLDVSDTEIDSVIQKQVVPSTFTFTSPATGAVIDKIVVEGSGVTAGMKLMRIEDHESLWLDLQVYESDVALVSVGQSVNAIVDAWPGRTIHGTISFIHPHLDYTSRTVMARATLDNTDQILHPGMYASATIMSTPVADAVLVPREAVIDTGTSQTAFVAHPGGHFEPRKVRMGILADDGRVQILEGLSPGEVVVTSGQFLLDVESRTTEAIDKLKEVSPAPANPSEARP
jgi:RND family efflux transporter MFP subunit